MRTDIGLFALLFVLLAVPMVGQDITTKYNPGLPINGVFAGSDFDMVQTNNGGLHIEIPLYSVPGRNGHDVTVKYVYEQLGWMEYVPCDECPSSTHPAGYHYGSGDGAAPNPANHLQWTIVSPISNFMGLAKSNVHQQRPYHETEY